jgi:hypothetical protein
VEAQGNFLYFPLIFNLADAAGQTP